LNLLPTAGRDLILAGAILTIMLNPLIFAAVDWLSRRLEQAPHRGGVDVRGSETQVGRAVAPAKSSAASQATRLTGHTILVGHGRVGSIVADALKKSSQPFLIIEDADDIIAKLREGNFETIVGNAARSDV